ncbi:MAG: glucosaminidase domain-containing protein [Candidatus Levyibacteriota bacterium]|nr:MAG: glucosaminidase domain-containing protein [Candidatus Levybacteria bacterium]
MVKKGVLLFTVLAIIYQNFIPNVFAQKSAGSSAVSIVTLPEQEEDARVKILKKYLEKYNSPLVNYASVFVAEADKNNIDYRLLVAISGVESTFGQQIPNNSYNAWGWGIYGDNMIRFSSWNEAIATISGELRQKYINQWGAKDVYQIGRFYAASPTWASRVNYFMEKINAFALKNPGQSLPISL